MKALVSKQVRGVSMTTKSETIYNQNNFNNEITDIGHYSILALHGRGSNTDITQLQVNNLGWKFKKIHYVEGSVSSENPGLGIEGNTQANWYSWIPEFQDIDGFNENTCIELLCDALEPSLMAVLQNGPFNFIYGFSQGAEIASLLNKLPQYPQLIKCFLQRGFPLDERFFEKAHLFNAAIFANASQNDRIRKLILKAKLKPVHLDPALFSSLHLIGLSDPLRADSEKFCVQANNGRSDVIYMEAGHEVILQPEQIETLSDWIKGQSHDMSYQLSPTTNFKTSLHSDREIAQFFQIAQVSTHLPSIANTILEALHTPAPETPFFHKAGEADHKYSSTYGDFISFIEGGEGDLRRIGVSAGQKVAYVVPSSGSILSASIFLTVSSQACAIPVSPTLTQHEASIALNQFNPDHIIVFEDISCAGVIAALDEFNLEDKTIDVHYARETETYFCFNDSKSDFQKLEPLRSKASEEVLLLRTSGTTSLPKIVPLRQIDLMQNAFILAEGIGLKSSDVTYSVMPLDHIGGLSASLLSTIVVGASIVCDEQYSPEKMVDALLHSNPKPTWYSAVPTIHNGTRNYIQNNRPDLLDKNNCLIGHNLRFIRSGAAALRLPDQKALQNLYSCEVITTYSMSEQMPICQPAIVEDSWHQEDNAIGVPVAASVAIVDPNNLMPLPFGKIGEICIQGDNVFSGYQDNEPANLEAHFLLRLSRDSQAKYWFKTGDLGEMKKDGTILLKGRNKELIKRGGEQVSPYEIEDMVRKLDLIELAICFGIPSDIYGEEVGCAIVLSSKAEGMSEREVKIELNKILRKNNLSSYKIPSTWEIVSKNDLPKTKNGKYIRTRCAEALGLPKKQERSAKDKPPPIHISSHKPHIDNSAMAGLRFLLACYVMFMHIGASDSWDMMSNLRQFPWHVHMFFAVAGFSLAITMPPSIPKKGAFIFSRIMSFYPLYIVAIGFSLVNLLAFCQPSNFSSQFNWIGGLTPQGHCHGTPLFQDNWSLNLISTLIIHLTGLQASPLWQASWWMGFYLWFISMYIQCIVMFPFFYNILQKLRGETKKLIYVTLGLLAISTCILVSFWTFYAVSAPGYGLYDPETGMRLALDAEQIAEGAKANKTILNFYLFAPFWALYFLAGATAAFIYDAIRPNEWNSKKIWGVIADVITCIIIGLSILQVMQGYISGTHAQLPLTEYFMRPDAANQLTDPAVVNRLWDNIYPRLFAPLTLLWIFAIATGQGITAWVLRKPFIAKTLAPTALGCFLFHQMVAQWYYAITRDGVLWNWWDDQKTFYWFSPNPVPVEWYEYFYIVGLVVLFTKAIEPVDPMLRQFANKALIFVRLKQAPADISEKSSLDLVLNSVEDITGLPPEASDSLQECGLASLSLVQFISNLENAGREKIQIALEDILAAKNLMDIAVLIDKEKINAST